MRLCDSNIKFNRQPTAMNRAGTRWSFTLTVVNTRGKYGKLNPITGRRTHALCWHGHGKYFRILFGINPNTIIQSTLMGKTEYNQHSSFQDKMVGSLMYPYYASECCECDV